MHSKFLLLSSAPQRGYFKTSYIKIRHIQQSAGPYHQKGFTLLELLVVMVIIGLLAAYVGPQYFSQLGKSEQSAAKLQIDAIAKALDSYRLDTGSYPNINQGLSALNNKPSDEPKWQGPYMKKTVPLDPWGRAYIYRIPGSDGEFDLLSYGKDGRLGGDKENSDISLH